ncbi:PPC domain [Dillenia turbinata]|uniref:AT-hook motif nuclear-localized protein n=1 Tax=Dillenia turbinata TaxID=194707 RepID=A0AAN8VM54_9MAGN
MDNDQERWEENEYVHYLNLKSTLSESSFLAPTVLFIKHDLKIVITHLALFINNTIDIDLVEHVLHCCYEVLVRRRSDDFDDAEDDDADGSLPHQAHLASHILCYQIPLQRKSGKRGQGPVWQRPRIFSLPSLEPMTRQVSNAVSSLSLQRIGSALEGSGYGDTERIENKRHEWSHVGPKCTPSCNKFPSFGFIWVERDEKEPSEDFLNDEETDNGDTAGQDEWREAGEFDLNTRYLQAVEMAHQQTQSNEQQNGTTGLEVILALPAMQMPMPAQPTEAGVPLHAGKRRGGPVGSGARHPRAPAPAPTPSPFPWSIIYGGDCKPLTAILRSGEDLAALLESVALKESRVLCINTAQGRLSLVSLAPQGPSTTSPLFYEGRWEILSLTGVFKPSNNVGTDHPIGRVTVRCSGQMGEVIEGRIGGPVIVDTAVVVCMTIYNCLGEANPKRQRRTGPRAPVPVPSQEGTPSSPSNLGGENFKATANATVNPSNETDANANGC